MTGLNRRELFRTALAGPSSLLLAGCSQNSPAVSGDLLSPALEIGHRIRDGNLPASVDVPWQDTDIVIVGGGIAGLSAGWRLHRAGVDQFAVLELETVPGGTSRWGTSHVSPYPWGAHYVPVPHADNHALWQLLEEMGAAEQDDAGNWIAKEHVLCREPHERLCVQGRWSEGLYPASVATDDDLQQWAAFQSRIAEWIDWRDAEGRPAFTIPLAGCSTDDAVVHLDRMTMADWMRQAGWHSEPLFRVVDYCCQDDYGLTVEQTSAWAGVFYFASRLKQSGQPEPPLLTWPAGNGRIVQHLAQTLDSHVRTGQAVLSIEQHPDPAGRVRVVVLDRETDRVRGLLAQRVIFAAPQFLTRSLIIDAAEQRVADAREFQYGSWVVANVHLTDRPPETGFPLSWDNVIYDSPSLGYVVATHQQGIDHGPTVWTWYLPLCEAEPAEARRKLLDLPWKHWANLVITDLERGHPEIRKLITRIDVMRWGHAMIQPRPGLIWGSARKRAAIADGVIHFAGTDLSGLALMEEAFYHGVRAAEEVLAEQNIPYSGILES